MTNEQSITYTFRIHISNATDKPHLKIVNITKHQQTSKHPLFTDPKKFCFLPRHTPPPMQVTRTPTQPQGIFSIHFQGDSLFQKCLFNSLLLFDSHLLQLYQFWRNAFSDNFECPILTHCLHFHSILPTVVIQAILPRLGHVSTLAALVNTFGLHTPNYCI